MPMESTLLRLPNTLEDWPWPRVINPLYEEVKKESDAWFQSFKALSGRSQYAFDKCNFGLLAAMAYPCASREHLRTGCDLMNLFFVIDEYTDVESASVVREIADVVIDAMSNPHKPRPQGEVVLGEIARQFWALAIKTASPTSQKHMVESFTAYLESVVEQAGHRDANAYLTVSEYLKNRRQNVGSRPSFVVLEVDMHLPDDVFYHSVMVELTQFATDMIIIDNDIVSYNKEQAIGDDHHNILTIVMNEFNTDLNCAMQWAMDYHKAMQIKFLEDLKKVPSWGTDIDRQVRRYLYGLANWVRTNECWSFESGRYFGNKGVEYQVTRLVPLLPKVAPFRVDTSRRRENVDVPLIEELEKKM